MSLLSGFVQGMGEQAKAKSEEHRLDKREKAKEERQMHIFKMQQEITETATTTLAEKKNTWKKEAIKTKAKVEKKNKITTGKKAAAVMGVPYSEDFQSKFDMSGGKLIQKQGSWQFPEEKEDYPTLQESYDPITGVRNSGYFSHNSADPNNPHWTVMGTEKVEPPKDSAAKKRANELFDDVSEDPKAYGAKDATIGQIRAAANMVGNSEILAIGNEGIMVDRFQEALRRVMANDEEEGGIYATNKVNDTIEPTSLSNGSTAKIEQLQSIVSNIRAPYQAKIDALNQIEVLKKEQEKLSDRDYQEKQQEERDALQRELHEERLSQQERLQEERLDQSKKMQTMQEEGRQSRHVEVRVEAAAKRVAELYKGIQGEALASLEVLEREVEPFTYINEKGHIKTKDIPGFGSVEGALPDWAYGLASELGLSPESKEWGEKGLQMRQISSSLYNRILKIRSGAAITESELARLKQEFGQGFGRPDSNFALGLRMYRAIHNRYVALNLATIMNQDVVKEIAERQGVNLKLIDWARGYKKAQAEGQPVRQAQSYDDIMKASEERGWSKALTKEALKRWGY